MASILSAQHILNDPDSSPATSMAQLADQLITGLGVAEALRVCRENSWHGVLDIIQGQRNNATSV